MQYYRKGAEGVIAITTDKLYQVKQRIENGYLYLSFVNLHDIYDKVIIIDAGHGGRMTGARAKRNRGKKHQSGHSAGT